MLSGEIALKNNHIYYYYYYYLQNGFLTPILRIKDFLNPFHHADYVNESAHMSLFQQSVYAENMRSFQDIPACDMDHVGHVGRMSVSGYRYRRFEPKQRQYVVSLSKTHCPHCFSRHSCEISIGWNTLVKGVYLVL